MKTIWILAAGIALAGCKSTPGDQTRETKITVTGSSTIAPLFSEIAKRYEAEHPGLRIDVQTGGSGRGIADARSGVADLGMCSRALKDDERDLIATTIARDGVGIIVHAENPVGELTREQIIAIYTGGITDWSAVGGKKGQITVVSKAEGRSTLELFLAHFGLKPEHVNAAVVIGDNEQGVKTVAGNPGAIGYVSIGTAEYDAKAGIPIKLLPLGGVAATTENVRNGTFPLSRPLNIVTKTQPTGALEDFLRYSASAKVNDLVRGQYFVPITGES